MTELFSSPCSMKEFESNEDNIIRTCLTKCKTIALVGASPKPSLDSNEVMEYLLQNKFKVFPINPKYQGQQILGQAVYANLADVPERIDMVDVFRPSQEALEITKNAIQAKVSYIWLQLGIQNEEAKKIAEENGIVMIMNRCTLIEHKKIIDNRSRSSTG